MLDLVRSGVGLSLARDAIAIAEAHTHALTIVEGVTVPTELTFVALAARVGVNDDRRGVQDSIEDRNGPLEPKADGVRLSVGILLVKKWVAKYAQGGDAMVQKLTSEERSQQLSQLAGWQAV